MMGTDMPITDDEPKSEPEQSAPTGGGGLGNLSNILGLLSNNGANSGGGGTNDLQGMLLKMALSGELNGILGKKQDPPPRTVNLENYRRVD